MTMCISLEKSAVEIVGEVRLRTKDPRPSCVKKLLEKSSLPINVTVTAGEPTSLLGKAERFARAALVDASQHAAVGFVS